MRTYTAPPDDLLDLAADWGLRVARRRLLPRLALPRRVGQPRCGGVIAREAARRGAGGRPPAGRRRAACSRSPSATRSPPTSCAGSATDAIAGGDPEPLADVVARRRPAALVTYANYPTAEYLPLDGLDFLTFNVFLERQHDLRRYLTRLHHLAGDRPLVLGEIGLDAGTARTASAQAERLDWQLETAIERGVAGTCVFSWTDEWWVGDAAVEGWHFGLTRADRSPRPALDVAARVEPTARSRDLDFAWPSMQRRHLRVQRRGDARRVPAPHVRARLPRPRDHRRRRRLDRRHRGDRPAPPACSARRDRRTAGCRSPATRASGAASGDLVAYLDSDAYPTPEWPYYLALGLRQPDGRRRRRAEPAAARRPGSAPSRSPRRRAARCTC